MPKKESYFYCVECEEETFHDTSLEVSNEVLQVNVSTHLHLTSCCRVCGVTIYRHAQVYTEISKMDVQSLVH